MKSCSKPSFHSVVILFVFLLNPFADSASAESSAQYLPTGLVFPEFTHAGQMDAAALPFQGGSALQLEFAPEILQSNETIYDGTYTYSNEAWGLGVGYNGWDYSQNPGGGPNHTLFAGVGCKVPSTTLSVGLAMSSYFLTQTFSPTFDLSLQYGDGSKLQLALLFYDVPSNINIIGIGVGHREKGKYSLEGGLIVPFPTDFFAANSTYTLYLAGAIFAGPIGASFRAAFTYYDGPQSSFAQSLDSPVQNLGLLWVPTASLKFSILWNPGQSSLGPQINPTGSLTLGAAFEI